MAYVTQKRLPSIEAGAHDYAVELYRRLRCEHGWRKDTLRILRQEYATFVRMAIAHEFDVLAMCEYAWLVDATHQVLRAKGSKSFWAYFHRKVNQELAGIAACLRSVPFSEEEKLVMLRASKRMMPLIKVWEQQQ